MRAFRLMKHGKMDESLEKAIVGHPNLLDKIAVERIVVELTKILKGPIPSQIMCRAGELLLPGLSPGAFSRDSLNFNMEASAVLFL